MGKKKKDKKRFLDKDNTIELLSAYGFVIVPYPHFFKLIHEQTGNQWDWYWNKGALLRLEKSYSGQLRVSKYGNILDPEEVALLIKKYDIY